MANYTRGIFVEFRTTTLVHLGKIGVNLEKDETVSFDGQVLKTSSGTDYPDMQSLQSAIKVGWLVVATDSTSVYKPVQPATSSKISTALIHDEDRDVGNIKGIRDGAAVKRAGGDQTPKKFPTVTLAEGDEGTVVGSAVRSPVGATAPTVSKTAKAPFGKTYAVEQAAGDGEAVVVGSALRSAKTSTVISSENAQRVAQSIQNLDNTVGKRMPVVSDQSVVGQSTKTASVSQEINTKATVIPTDMGFDPKQAGIDSAGGGTVQDTEKLRLVQAVIPGFSWDMTGHWKTRVKVALEHKNDPMFIFGVMAVESAAVKKALQDSLATT